MRKTILPITAALLLLMAGVVTAHKPVIVGDDSGTPETHVTEPTVSHAYYGELSGEPHEYAFTQKEPFLLYVNILQPDPEPETLPEPRNFSVRIRHYRDGQKKQTLGMEATGWSQYYEKHGGDHYLRASPLERNATAGTYVITVSNENNRGKYTLAIGKEEDFGILDYVTAWFKAKYLDWWFFG